VEEERKVTPTLYLSESVHRARLLKKEQNYP